MKGASTTPWSDDDEAVAVAAAAAQSAPRTTGGDRVPPPPPLPAPTSPWCQFTQPPPPRIHRVRVVAPENRSNAATTITLQQLTLAPAPYADAGVDAVAVAAAEAVATGAATSTSSTPRPCHHAQWHVPRRQRGAHHAGAQALTTSCAQQQRRCILR